jgi:hypothetical protein
MNPTVIATKELVFFSDEEGQGRFMEHFCDKDGRFDAANKTFVFLGDSVDRGARGGTEIKMVRIFLDLQQSSPPRMYLLAGNRDVTKMRMRREFAIFLNNEDAFDRLKSILSGADKEFSGPDRVKNLQDFAINIIQGFGEEPTEINIVHILVSLAYQWLTRLYSDVMSPNERRMASETSSSKSARWMFDGNLVKTYMQPKIESPYTKQQLSALNQQSINRIVDLFKTYGITSYFADVGWDVGWKKWALEALKLTNNGLFFKYLRACKPFHLFKHGQDTFFCSHAIPSPFGIDSKWFTANLIKTSGIPIQRFIKAGPDGKDYTINKYIQPGKYNKTKLQTDVDSMMKNYNNLFSSESLERLLAAAPGHGDDVNVGKQNATRNNKEYIPFTAFGASIIVHGHQPFGMPYSQKVRLGDGTSEITRICVDVSRDNSKYIGDEFYTDPVTKKVERAEGKNWAYVIAHADGRITAIGSRMGKGYSISDMRNFEVTSANLGPAPFFPMKQNYMPGPDRGVQLLDNDALTKTVEDLRTRLNYLSLNHAQFLSPGITQESPGITQESI